jgi:cytochrome c-type biogenesis protein CcmH/NrfG
MQKDKVILLIIISLLVGFIFGAVTGILYVSKEGPHGHGPAAPPSGGAPPEPSKVVSSEDIGRYEGVLKTDPNNFEALVSLGNLYFDSNQYQKAIDVYARALKIQPKNSDVRTDMALMYRNLKDYDRAIKELKEAAAQDPKHVNSRYNLGVILLHDKKDFKGTIAAWEDYLKVEPNGEKADMVRQRLEQLRQLAK